MPSGQENKIRERAHKLWEKAGRPHGRDNEFWHQAEQEIAQEEGKDTPHHHEPSA